MVFSKKGGLAAEDYFPANGPLLKNKGMVVQKIRGDSKGLLPGLQVTRDFLGNPTTVVPDIGATEIATKN